MLRKIRLMLAAVACLFVGSMAQAQEVKGTPPPVANVNEAVLNAKGLHEMLTNLGYQVSVSGQNRDQFNISQKVGDATLAFRVALSPNGQFLWLDHFSRKLDPAKISHEILLEILKQNQQRGPIHFAYFADTQQMALSLATDNRGITPVKLRQLIDHFATNLHDVRHLFEHATLQTSMASEPKEVQEVLKKLQGTWRLAAYEDTISANVAFTQQQIASITAVVKGNIMEIKLPDGRRHRIVLRPTSGQAIDIVGPDSGATELGVYQFNGSELIIRIAQFGQPRPESATGPLPAKMVQYKWILQPA